MKDIDIYIIEKLNLKSNYKYKNYTFAGLKISSGPVYYDGSNFKISDSWKDNDSYNKIYGLEKGSFYFNWVQCNDIDIDGWRLPTKQEFDDIIKHKRHGCKVNNIENARYALIQLTGVNYSDSNNPNGVLLFPDDSVIHGKKLDDINKVTQNNSLTESELNEYLNQGCVFLPASGFNFDGVWRDGGIKVLNWSSSTYGMHAYSFHCEENNYMFMGRNDLTKLYYTIFLVTE